MAQTLLLWILLLTASVKLSASLAPDLRGEEYEVVRPIRLHSVTKRDAEHQRPQTIRYAMTVGGEDIEMHLEKNNEFLSKEYTETYYQEGGTPVTIAPRDIDHCYYHGRIVNDNDSVASLSTCDGLRGYFKTAAQRYLIEPLNDDDQGDHAVITYNDTNSNPGVCGVTNTTWSEDFEPPTSRSRSRSAADSIVYKEKFNELYLVADHREFIKMNRDLNAVRQRMFEIVNFVNMVYKPLRTFIALVGLEIWSDRDLISVTTPAGANLNAFRAWRSTDLLKRKKHDNAHLISGIDFDSATVGLAFVGTLCSDNSVGVVQDHNKRAIAVGATLAHEMGHNFGMNHDDSSGCACVGESCVMAAALSWVIPKSFSSCSSNSYERYLTSRTPACLLNKPDFNQLVSAPVCGNGFVEAGEECDCGTVEECVSPCCNATTCTLTEGSKCAAGECCEDCQIRSRYKECRSKRDECDLPEHCDGKSAICPEDVFAVNGLPCDGGLGYCYNGQCPQRESQCVKMYGPAAEVGGDFCYKQNIRGLYYAFCKRPAKETFIPCQKEDIMCGKLFCQKGKTHPNYGRAVYFKNCQATFYGDETKDYGQVDTGTKCGDGKVCNQNECVDLETAYRATNCSAKCPGHGVCNHRSECQCEPGWSPPKCNTRHDSGLSVGATASIITMVVLGILGGIAAAVGIMWKKRQSPILPTKQPPQNIPAQVGRRPTPSAPLPVPQVKIAKPKGRPPPPPPAGNRPKPQTQSYLTARQALRPVVPPKA